MTDDTKNNPRYTYLDMLTSALTDHERNLNQIIEKLDIIVEKISKLSSPEPSKTTRRIQQKTEDNDRHDEDTESLLRMARQFLPNTDNH
jgi:hypothetical protein